MAQLSTAAGRGITRLRRAIRPPSLRSTICWLCRRTQVTLRSRACTAMSAAFPEDATWPHPSEVRQDSTHIVNLERSLLHDQSGTAGGTHRQPVRFGVGLATARMQVKKKMESLLPGLGVTCTDIGVFKDTSDATKVFANPPPARGTNLGQTARARMKRQEKLGGSSHRSARSDCNPFAS